MLQLLARRPERRIEHHGNRGLAQALVKHSPDDPPFQPTDGALSNTAFVFVQSPRSGERVSSDFRVTGCSSTFEATVNWRLRARDGRELASGVTQGGSQEPGPFAFPVRYSVDARQVGQLEP